MFLQSFSRCDFGMPVSDLSHMGFPLLPRSPAHLEFLVSIFGMARCDPRLFASDGASVGPVVSTRSSACFGLAPSVFDFSDSESSILLRSFAQAGLAALLCDLSQLDSTVFLLDAVTTASSTPLRSLTRLDLVLPVPDFANLESVVSLKSFAQSDLSLPAFRFGESGSSTLSQSYLRAESVVLMCGMF